MDREYLKWLRSQVDFIDMPNDYSILFYLLHRKEFYAVIQMDENRAKDGLALRKEYYHDILGMEYGSYPEAQASCLEVLIGIAKRMNFICSAYDEDRLKEIFWHLLDNLGLSCMNDAELPYRGGEIAVDEILDRWMDRTFKVDGAGSPFPMAAPKQNQRNIEIWYQMNQYLNDPNGVGLKGY